MAIRGGLRTCGQSQTGLRRRLPNKTARPLLLRVIYRERDRYIEQEKHRGVMLPYLSPNYVHSCPGKQAMQVHE